MSFATRGALALVLAAIAFSGLDSGAGEREGRPSGGLARITLKPAKATRSVGQAQNYTAIAHDAAGERNVTQQVRYASSDRAIARAPNTPGRRSRVEAVGPGTVTITATDPATGVSTSDTGDDATLTVLGALERLSLKPAAATRTIGQAQNFTATGHFAGGGTRNMTQQVRYRSSNPNVARAPNREGMRSRIEAVGAGTATISAVDPATGISTTDSEADVTLTVLGALERLELAPSSGVRAVGQTTQFTATGYFTGGATQNLTQRVVYASSDPGVAVAANAEGDRSRVLLVGVGTATISATDPRTGIATTSSGGDATVTVVAAAAKASPRPAASPVDPPHAASPPPTSGVP